MDKKKTNHILTAQCIRITLFVYVYIRAVDQEIAFLDSFLNPLFFFLDGAVFQILEKENFFQFTFRKFRQFILPYYFLAFLLLCAEIGFAPYEGLNVTSEWIFNRIFLYILPEVRVYSLWYLPALFCSEMICYFVVKLSRDRLCFGCLWISVVFAFSLVYNTFCHRFLPWSLDTAFIGSFYSYIGYITTHKKTEKLYYSIFRNRWISFAFGVIFITIAFFCSQALYRYCDGAHFSGSKALYSPYYYVIPLSFVGVYGILFFAHAFENLIFISIGKMTMIILAFEQEIGIKLYRYFIAKNWYVALGKDIPFEPEQVLCAICGTLWIVLVSVPLYYFFMKTPLCVIFNRKFVGFKKAGALKEKENEK